MNKSARLRERGLGVQFMGYRFLVMVFMAAIFGIGLSPVLGHAASIPLNEKGIYSTSPDDGGVIYLYRYAPYTTGTPAFRTKGTPVLLFPGIGMTMNQYLSCTPPGMEDEYSIMSLPPVSQAPDWILNAKGTDYIESIKADKMRFYNLAHFLWLKGYDVWLMNYRDTGRAPLHSQGNNRRTLNTLDTWATLDTPAAIAKVKAVTGKRMFIGGHSTGALVGYAYLQGAYMDYGKATTAAGKKAYYNYNFALGIQPHVKGDAALAKARNAEIKGLIALDPAGLPPLPSNMDTSFMWSLVATPLYLPLDNMGDYLFQLVPSKTMYTMEDMIFGYLNKAALADNGENLFTYMNFWLVKNMEPCMEDWVIRYSCGGTSIRAFGHYMDLGLNKTIREHYLNGKENYMSNSKLTKGGGTPDPANDGYYYYDRNMSRMTVPLLTFSSTAGALVSPTNTYNTIISKKMPTAYDEWYVVNGTAHVDVALGKKMPLDVFPQLGYWLEMVDALTVNPPNTSKPATRNDL